MVKRYYKKEQLTIKNVEIFECPDCGFEFNAMHEVDEQVGGWECPLCEVEELQNYHTAYKNEAQSNIQGLMSNVERYEEMNKELKSLCLWALRRVHPLHQKFAYDEYEKITGEKPERK